MFLTNTDVSGQEGGSFKAQEWVSANDPRRYYFCKSIAIQMGAVS